MKSSPNGRTFQQFVIFAIAFCAFAALPLLSKANSATTITIVNNSSRQIRNLYLSHVNADDWGNNQLGNTVIGPGQTFTVQNLNWDQPQVKLIGEDQDGCFLTTVVNCGGSVTWTIPAILPQTADISCRDSSSPCANCCL